MRKHNAAGTVLWTEQFGSSDSDYALSPAVNGSGNIYVAGYTEGDLEGANAGGSDAFVRIIEP